MSAAAPPVLFVEREAGPEIEQVDRGPRCPAEVGIVPTPYFRERVLLRLPAGLDEEQLSEASTGLVATDRPTAMGCLPGLSAKVFLLTYEAPMKHPMTHWREQVFEAFNYPEEHELRVVAGREDQSDVSIVLSFPDDPVWGEIRVYLRMIVRDKRMVAAAFAADEDSWHALEPSFAASAATMLVVPESG